MTGTCPCIILFEYAGACGGFIGQYDYATEILWATGAALLVRERVYNNVGGWTDASSPIAKRLTCAGVCACRATSPSSGNTTPRGRNASVTCRRELIHFSQPQGEERVIDHILPLVMGYEVLI